MQQIFRTVLLFLLLMGFHAHGQNITAVEYFIDTDPGVGMATPLAITPAAQIDQVFNIDLSGLAPGLHQIFFRVQEGSLWGIYQSQLFYVEPLGTKISILTDGEYFFDSDPGFGNAIPFDFADGTLVNHQFAASVSGLSPGLHQLFVRVRDDLGNWSLYGGKLLYVEPFFTTPDVVSAEYFFDSDPGVGLATAIDFPDGATVEPVLDIPTTGLSGGLHQLYIRVLNSDGLWSIYESQLIYIDPLFSVAKIIVSAEFFIDTDPGEGNGIPLSVTPGAQVDETLQTAIDSLNLTPGSYTFALRVLDDQGLWSIPQSIPLNIVAAEPEIEITRRGLPVPSPTTIDIGTELINVVRTDTLLIRNTGTGDLIISALNVTGDPVFSSPLTLPVTISPGDSLYLPVEFQASFLSTYFADLEIINNDSDEGSYLINYLAETATSAEPEIQVTEFGFEIFDGDTYDFGAIDTLSGGLIDFIITNLGSADLFISFIDVTGTEFILDKIPADPIPPGSFDTLSIFFAPTSIGPISEELTIESDDPFQPTFTVFLTGEGLAPTFPELDLTESGLDLASGDSFDVGAVDENDSLDISFVVTNNGTGDLNITDVNISGTVFTIVDGLPSVLAPGQSDVVIVRFLPGQPGSFNEILEFVSDDPINPFFTIDLTGEGIPLNGEPELDISSGGNPLTNGDAVDLGSVEELSTNFVDFILENTGFAELQITSLTFSNPDLQLLGNAPASIASGSFANITVQVVPSTVGTLSDQMTIVSNDADEGTYVINFSAQVAAIPQPDLQLLVDQTPLNADGTLDFGAAILGDFLDQQITLRNEGSVVLILGNPTVIGSEFEVVQSPPGQIDPGQEADMMLRFEPVARGNVSGGLSIPSDDPDTPDYNVTLTGEGIEGELKIRNLITPNGDGQSDYLFIENLEQISGTKRVTILDRWGRQVGQTLDNFVNDDPRLVSFFEDFQPGNYICVLDLEDGRRIKQEVTILK